MSHPHTPNLVSRWPVTEGGDPAQSTVLTCEGVQASPAGEWVLIGALLAEAALLGYVLRASATEAVDLPGRMGEAD